MRLYLVTDMEGVAGVKDVENWCEPGGSRYDAGKTLTTLEVNAAIDGFLAGGFTHVSVLDGHGVGGLNPDLLDSRAERVRGPSEVYPPGLEAGYDAMAWVGQHAKAGTPYSHLTHTQSFRLIDLRLNGFSIGEFGQCCLCGRELGVPAVFASGELALEAEARALVPAIHFAAVKRGVQPDGFDHLTTEQYGQAKLEAEHQAPEQAQSLIRQRAEEAARHFRDNRPDFTRGPSFAAPFELEVVLRADRAGDPPLSQTVTSDSLQEAMHRLFELIWPQ